MRRWRGKRQNMLICRENASRRGGTRGYSQWRSRSEAFCQSLSGDLSLHLALQEETESERLTDLGMQRREHRDGFG
ncbi:hypothetical protein DPMN_015802 [Dreissena polymorpha]|uniref:Uncharacterized protein n=1 Tax=Dreissena polymorpha TaxID=45954 RepID=A0A9D4N8G7_DREPO|nr:hypothetical protein DPMN_015802 [Dreissena polymorpha]